MARKIARYCYVNQKGSRDKISTSQSYSFSIKRKLDYDKEAARAVEELFEAEKMEEMLEYIQTYADSVDTEDKKDTRSKKRGNCTSI